VTGGTGAVESTAVVVAARVYPARMRATLEATGVA
jgi:hypothetical protein